MIFANLRDSRKTVFPASLLLAFILSTIVVSAQTAGLVAAYGFNEGSGNTVSDLSGNHLNGKVYGATWTSPGKYGGALSFNGTSSYVDLGNPAALQLTGSMTLEAWVRASADPADDGQIVAKSDNTSGWQLKSSPDTGVETFGIAVAASSGSRAQRYSTTVRSLNTWYHVAGVYNSSAGTLTIYINGVPNSGTLRGTVPASIFASGANVNIGRRTGGFYFNGIIDEVRIYNRALSQAEIQSDMTTPIGAPTADTQPPIAPSSLTATSASTTQINLSWAASTDNVAVVGYRLERCQGAGCTSFSQIGTTNGTNYSDSGLSPGVTYGYRVRATDAAENLSGYSNVASTTTATNPPPPPLPTAGRVAAYSLNEGSGTTASDSSGNALNGTLQGATWTASGKYGKALSFNGTGSYVDLGNPSALQMTGSMTLSAWVLPTANPPDDGQIVAKSNSDGWELKSSPDTGVRSFAIAISDGVNHIQRYSKTVPSLNTLYNVAGVYNASARTLDIYVNGVLDNGVLRGTVPVSQANSGVNANIGRRTGGYLFQGMIDEVRVYNTALTQAQIQSDMNTPVGSSGTPDTQAPTVPANLSATATGSAQINLTWTESTDNVSLSGYRVERCQGVSCSSFVQIASPTGTSYSDATGLSAGTSYRYRVRAADTAGNLSAYSSVATATTAASDTQPPTAPTNLAGNAVSASQVNLTWTASTDNVGVTGYRVFRGSTQVADVGATAYSDSGLIANTTYIYNVEAHDAAGNISPTSQSVSVTTPQGTSTSAPVYPLKASPSGRSLVDQNGVPFLITGDAPHTMFVNISVADASTYLADRAAHGINSVWVEVLANSYVGNYHSGGSTYDGIAPFTNPNDISTPNPAYFSRVDQMINIAANNGITVFLDAFETAGWMSFLRTQGNTKAFNWGVYLGNRYKNFPNIVWITGNDFQTWNTSTTDNTLVKNIMAGIASVDTNHLQTLQLNYDISGSLDNALLVPYVSLAGAYTYEPTYDEVLVQYNKSNSSVPVMLQEAHYENEAVGGCCGESGTPNVLRRQGYWSLLAGALAGQMYGNRYTVSFPSGWQNNIDTVGVKQLGYWKTFFTSLRWYDLIPDQTHSVVTAGYGTYDTLGSLASSDYVTTARTLDGKLVLSYTPVTHTLTVDMTRLAGTVTARWFDPSNGTYRTISGSPFANTGSRPFTSPGSNSAGDQDWVLVLQAP